MFFNEILELLGKLGVISADVRLSHSLAYEIADLTHSHRRFFHDIGQGFGSLD